ncbi:MAG: recombinase family protein [Rudaea sp.]|nr:recombinase family protein [Rudaea sp.]
MRLIAYLRVSTEEQAGHGHSIGHQLDRVRAYCALHEHELVDVIADEGVSASLPLAKRQGGAALQQALRTRRASGVVVVRLDRLFRNAFEGLRFFEEELPECDASVHSITEVIDTSTPSGWLALGMGLLTADYARRLDVQRGRETNRALREQGRVFGNVPFGCIAVGGEAYVDKVSQRDRVRGARLMRDPKQWAIREQIVRRRSAGMTYSRLIEMLREQRVPSPTGERGWSKSTLKNLCESHAGLLHLPMAEEANAAISTITEIQVSRHVRH